MSRIAALFIPSLLLGCSEGSEVQPLFPASYASSYVEVRDCRSSSDHELNKIRVLADSSALGVYTDRAGSFPEGSILLKEEYDFADGDCTGPVQRWTVMLRTEAAPSGWRWQDVSVGRIVVEGEEARCVNCHVQCGRPPEGWEGTCTVP